MNYFLFDFSYVGKKSNMAECDESNITLSVACKALDTCLSKIDDVLFKHAYFWTDGALYSYARCESSSDELSVKIVSALEGQKIVSLKRILFADPNEDPSKASAYTLREYMDEP